MNEQALSQIVNLKTLKNTLEYIRGCSGDETAVMYRRDGEMVCISREMFFNDCMRASQYFSALSTGKLAILSENSYLWAVAFFGITTCGKIAVLLDSSTSAEENRQMLEASECDTVLYSEQCGAIAAQLDSTLIKLENICSKAEIVSAEAEVPTEKSIAAFFFTSGTTGRRRVVPLTHENLLMEIISNCKLIRGSGKVISVLPFYHSYGLVTSLLLTLVEGCTVFINDGLRNLPADIGFCQSYVFPAVPAIIETVVKLTRAKKDPQRLRQFFGPNLKIVVSGGGPLNKEVRSIYKAADIQILEGYGLTECSSSVAFNYDPALYGDSLGIALEGCEFKIADSGEILVRGRNVMNGYYNDPEENAKVFIDGWFRTGDIGRIGEQGELYLTGRIKKLIILSNGENIPAEPLEQLIYKLPYIKEAVVHGVEGIITAEVFPYEEAGDISAQLKSDIERINRTLPLNSCIMNTIIRKCEFPKTSTNKIMVC